MDLENTILSKCKSNFTLVLYIPISNLSTHTHIILFVFSLSLLSKQNLGKILRSTTITNQETMMNPVTSSCLVLSGSRGIGGISCSHSNVIDMFDLEDDEIIDEDEDEDGAFNMDSTSNGEVSPEVISCVQKSRYL